jgi:hypothetical protein
VFSFRLSVSRHIQILALALIAVGAILLFNPDQFAHAQGCRTPARLAIGYSGYVIPGTPNAVRDRPGLTAPSAVIGQIAGGEFFTVLNGPTCVDGYNWWLVQTNNISGWTADGDATGYWVTPHTCDGIFQSRLRPGIQGRVTPGDPNVLRESPGVGNRIGLIPAGGVFTVVSDPACDGLGRTWWYVNYNGLFGWTGEGANGVYWVEPVTGTTPPPPPTPNPVVCSPTPRLQAGRTGMVIPGDPNALRDQPGRNASGSRVIGSLAGGAIFRVIEGPRCVDGHNWWRVTAGGRTGWTAEGQGGVYWLDPLVCANGLTSQLAPGMRATVTPGLPNRIRTAPSESTGFIIGRIPSGATMLVLGNFQCDAQGRMWWLVNYAGIVGWTVEGANGQYWLSPA